MHMLNDSNTFEYILVYKKRTYEAVCECVCLCVCMYIIALTEKYTASLMSITMKYKNECLFSYRE